MSGVRWRLRGDEARTAVLFDVSRRLTAVARTLEELAGAWPAPSAARELGDFDQQLLRRDAKGTGQGVQCRERDVALPTLDRTDIGAVISAHLCELLLRDVCGEAETPDIHSDNNL
jgi:hypothetical protein